MTHDFKVSKGTYVEYNFICNLLIGTIVSPQLALNTQLFKIILVIAKYPKFLNRIVQM